RPRDPVLSARAGQHARRSVRARGRRGRDADIECFVVSADRVVDGEAERAVRKLPRGAGRLLYRGPILSAEEYEMLYEAVEERGAELVVDPIAYEHALYVPEHHD